ncbi:MAG: methyltransferase, partial [Deltaproteobacteria bacterium]
MSAEGAVIVSRHGVDRLRKGHVWVYRSDVRAPRDVRGGEVVRLEDERGYFLGKAFYGKTSEISVRLLTREDEAIDEDFFVRRLAAAKELREAAQPDPERIRAARIVHGESDLLPGLVVDRYADVLSIQT